MQILIYLNYVRTGRLSYDSRQHEITARQGKACDANDLPVMPSSELSLYTAIVSSLPAVQMFLLSILTV